MFHIRFAFLALLSCWRPAIVGGEQTGLSMLPLRLPCLLQVQSPRKAGKQCP
jgi:hypothetical protein